MTFLERFNQSLGDVGLKLKGVSVGSDPNVTPEQIAAEIQRSLTAGNSPVAQWFLQQQAKGLTNMNVSFFDTEADIDVDKAMADILAAEAAIEAGQFRQPPQPKDDIPVEVKQIFQESKISQ